MRGEEREERGENRKTNNSPPKEEQNDAQMDTPPTFFEPRSRVDGAGLSDDHRQEELQGFLSWGVQGRRSVKMVDREKRGDGQMTMGVAWATLPTSSSFCMIFFMRACRRVRSVWARSQGEGRRTTGNLVCLFLFFMMAQLMSPLSCDFIPYH